MVAVTRYQVAAKWWEHMWELHVDGVGVTQTESVAEAEAMVRDLLYSYDLDDKADIEITWQLGNELDAEVSAARQAVSDAAAQQIAAANAQRAVAAKLKACGLKGREIAAVLGVSEQRASQLTRPAKP